MRLVVFKFSFKCLCLLAILQFSAILRVYGRHSNCSESLSRDIVRLFLPCGFLQGVKTLYLLAGIGSRHFSEGLPFTKCCKISLFVIFALSSNINEDFHIQITRLSNINEDF